tara:strand:+ start:4154 stop:5029 length:876 start_codon:yes stop_codon:yes gene_type:complete
MSAAGAAGSTAGATGLSAGMSTALGVVGAVGALFGIAGAISQATAARRAIDRANEEAALAVAQARDKLSKIDSLELELPMIEMDQIQKDSLRQRKQLLDAVRGSGQRSVLGAVPVIGEQASKEKQKIRGQLEKQIRDRQDKILTEEARKEQLELEMLTAQGVAARQRAAAAAQNEAVATAGAGRSAAALGGEILGLTNLYGGEGRFQRNVDKFLEGKNLGQNFDRDAFASFVEEKAGIGVDSAATYRDATDLIKSGVTNVDGTEVDLYELFLQENPFGPELPPTNISPVVE